MLSAMSQVVPLPSFGEVFFDARGQDRVLRITWHHGTLVLSLWRGDMCTASFRMPLSDVGRLIDALDEGLAEAESRLAQEENTGPLPRQEEAYARDDQQEYHDYPGTGQYARPSASERSYQDGGYQPREQYPQAGGYQAEPYQPAAQEQYPTAALGPNDLLVARGNPPQDRLVASSSGHAQRSRPQGHVRDQRHEPMPDQLAHDPVVDPNDPLGLGPMRGHRDQRYGGGERPRSRQHHDTDEWETRRDW